MSAKAATAKLPVIALAGNPGAGKTTLFNALTGAREETGNRPGVTVETKERCAFRPGGSAVIVDLPGVYDLGSTTELEELARDHLVYSGADAIINVVDATNLDRNLYLTVRLLEAGARLVIALNGVDRLRPVSATALARELGVPVVETVATRGEGVVELLTAAVELAGQRRPHPRRGGRRSRRDRRRRPLGGAGHGAGAGADGFRLDYGPEVEQALAELAQRLERVTDLPWPARWVAVRLLEQDEYVIGELADLARGSDAVRAAAVVARSLETRLGADVVAHLAATRYAFIHRALSSAAVDQTPAGPRPAEARRGRDPARGGKGPAAAGGETALSLVDRIDQVATHRHAGMVLLGVVMWATFKLTFTLGGPLIDLVSRGVAASGAFFQTTLQSAGTGPLITSLVVDGLLGGVGSVLVFVPPIFLLFAALALLEESGYVTRASFVMDRFMRSLGLQGRAFVPLVLGFGCNVPAILAARTLEGRRDRLVTILISPLMSCSGRLPVYTLFAGAFFGASQGLVLFSLYLLGVVMAVLMARLITRRLLPGESPELVLELAPYRWPSAGRVFRHAWNNAWSFIQKAGTVIAGGVVMMWALANLPWGVEYASRESVLGQLGSAVAVFLAPAGLGGWENGAALVFGFWSKEFVVAALGVVHGAADQALPLLLRSHFTPLTAVSFMVLSLLYAPCLATVVAIRRESGSWKWAAFTVAYSVALGLALATAIYQVGTRLGL